ncbi:hypothetical protein GON03_05455 [Nocardioides sp. MAH-18]|uniref:Uncharacterized protein n=1 Tax=Nocardioides agri TaxID=2682843 RepID=A0A6L6XMX9_9ACTN|nr:MULTISPECIES: hypothetical protein [unclassified Nocardioides]MBA2953754.1 hypothetical protein [Nocardioides sp. CGMCC 1.13656]MVQ48619.1 hypothetical protein [Nocardioides sp. MAH-18]
MNIDELARRAGHDLRQTTPFDTDMALRELHRAAPRRRLAQIVAVCATAALVVVAAVVFSRQASRTDGVGPIKPDTPDSGVRYAASFVQPPLHVVLPSWTGHALTDQEGYAASFQEQDCAGFDGASPCPADGDLKFRLLTLRYFYPGGQRSVVQFPSYSDYVAALDALGPAGIAEVNDRSTVTVGGRRATVMAFEVLRDAPGAVSCAFPELPAESCAPLIAGRAVRMAVVDQGAEGLPPTVFYLSLNGDAPDRANRFAEFDTMLETVAFR